MSEAAAEVYDVVVVGSGAGGLVGALTAAELGLRVLVVEKATTFGGTTALSGAGLWAPANQHVLAAGQPDSLELARTYMQHTVGDRTPASMQDTFLSAAAEVIAWLEERGVRFAFMTGYPDYRPEQPGALLTGRAITPKVMMHATWEQVPYPVRPTMPMGSGGPPIPDTGPTGPKWGGQSLIAQLLMACESRGVALLASTAFTDLVVEDGRVVGIHADRDGADVVLGARLGVLLASGGFERNAAMRAEHSIGPAARADWTLGVPENTGDGIRAAIALGAATDLLEDCWWAPGFLRPDGQPSFLLWERVAPGGIVVDREGRRWINEGTDYNTFGHLMLAAEEAGRPVIPSWWVMDQHFVDTNGFGGLRPGADTQPWVDAGVLLKADTVAGLAELIGTAELPATIERWNGYVAAGVDEELGRGAEGSHERQLLAVFQRYPGIAGPHEYPNPCLAPIAEGPFYAGQVVLSDLGTKGGVVCDESARVLDKDGQPLPGLYACGNTMASMMGHAYPGPGACITPAMAFGHLAVAAMADSVDGGARLNGSVVLVTGGSRGVGRGIADGFAQAGAQVVVCGRKEPAESPYRFVACDVRDPDAAAALVRDVVEHEGRLDVVVNNAGGSPYADAATMSPRLAERVVALNLLAPFYVAQAANAVMQEQPDGGLIVNIGSVAARRPAPGTSAYNAAKAGLAVLTRSLALEWAPKVRVNQVSPGLVQTESDVYAPGVERTIPMARLAVPADIAAACLMLAGPGASFITGADLYVDGGGETPAFLTGGASGG